MLGRYAWSCRELLDRRVRGTRGWSSQRRVGSPSSSPSVDSIRIPNWLPLLSLLWVFLLSPSFSRCHSLRATSFSLAAPVLSAEIVNMIKSNQRDYACGAGFVVIRGRRSFPKCQRVEWPTSSLYPGLRSLLVSHAT